MCELDVITFLNFNDRHHDDVQELFYIIVA